MRLVGLARCPVGSQSRSGRASGRSTELTNRMGLRPRPGQLELRRGWHGSSPRQAQSLLVSITGASGRILAQNSAADRRCCPGAVSVVGLPPAGGHPPKGAGCACADLGEQERFSFGCWVHVALGQATPGVQAWRPSCVQTPSRKRCGGRCRVHRTALFEWALSQAASPAMKRAAVRPSFPVSAAAGLLLKVP